MRTKGVVGNFADWDAEVPLRGERRGRREPVKRLTERDYGK